MSQSLTSIYVHAVFSTKHRQPFLDAAIAANAHAYIAGVCRRLGCEPIAVGGVADHVHVLVRLGKDITIANWMRDLKRISSVHIKQQVPQFAWQSGYGAFAVEHGRLSQVAAYVRSQEEHHRIVTFQDELRALLKEVGVQWDEEHLWT